MADNQKKRVSLIHILQPQTQATDEWGAVPEGVSCVKRRLMVCMLEGSKDFEGAPWSANRRERMRAVLVSAGTDDCSLGCGSRGFAIRRSVSRKPRPTGLSHVVCSSTVRAYGVGGAATTTWTLNCGLKISCQRTNLFFLTGA